MGFRLHTNLYLERVLDSYVKRLITITHWFPIITFCPVNKLPDLIFIDVVFAGEFVELYQVRKRIRKLLQFKEIFMEDAANEVAKEFPDCYSVSVKLIFNKHQVNLLNVEDTNAKTVLRIN